MATTLAHIEPWSSSLSMAALPKLASTFNDYQELRRRGALVALWPVRR